MRQLILWLQAIVTVNGAQEKPNIVFVFVDDLGWADVGFHNPKVQVTPFLDKMAKSGHAMELGRVYSTHRFEPSKLYGFSSFTENNHTRKGTIFN